MTEHKPSKNLWAFSSLAATMGDGAADFAADDYQSFRRQEFAFASLNLLLIGALLALQAVSRFVRGRPSASVIIVLAVGLTVQAAHLVRFAQRAPRFLARRRTNPHVLVSRIQLDAGVGAHFVNHPGRHCVLRPDASSHLEASFRLGLGATLAVIALPADFISFLGAYGLKFGEYIEAGAMSVIYSVMGVLVWLLVNNLRAREASFMRDLPGTRRTYPSAIAL